MRLENWYITGKGISPMKSPEDKKLYMNGEVYGSNRFKDGKSIKTSEIKIARSGKITTENKHIYELGVEHSTYEKEYPNAITRLMLNINLK